MQTPLEVAKQLAEEFRSQLQGLPDQSEFESTVHALVQTALARLDLVTRDEFDAQKEVLHRTRELAEDLERRLSEMEKGE